MKGKGFYRSAIILSVGGFLAKVLGALYRIPLTNFLGGEGIGVYQMAYPVYCLLLTFSASAVPSVLSRVISADPGSGAVKTAFRLFCGIGLVGSLCMAGFSGLLAAAQGYDCLKAGYLALAPSVLLVSAISVLRGYFQGRNNMLPTAVSELTEQAVKLAFGLYFAWRFQGNLAKAVVYTLFAVSISEGTTLLLLLRWYRRSKKPQASCPVSARSLLAYALPVTATSLLLPASQLLDSFLIVRLLPAARAVGEYGLYSGCATTLINLPVSICYGFAAAVIPKIAAEERAAAQKSVLSALFVTLATALPMVLALVSFPKLICGIVFRSLSAAESGELVSLIRLMAFGAFFLAGTQTLSASLTGLGCPRYSTLAMGAGILVKTLAEALLLPRIGILGAGISLNLCYLVAFLFDLYYIKIGLNRIHTEVTHDNDRRTGGNGGRLDGGGSDGDSGGAEGAGPDGTRRVRSLFKGA